MWESVKSINFEVILDIGCAEGFNACGLAGMFPNATVYAFDTDKKARKYCLANAVANNLKNVIIRSECTDQFIAEICNNQSSFILCDIEGAEKELFSAINVSTLSNTYILMELHDGVDLTISSFIKARFSITHNIESFFSTDDIRRPHKWASSNTPDFSLQELYLVMREDRGYIMEWVFLVPKIKNAL